MGVFTFAVSTALTATFLAQPGGALPDAGVPAAAQASSAGGEVFLSTGADPSVDQSQNARGEASLEVRDRTDDPKALHGDAVRFSATLREGVDRFTVEVTQAGVPDGTDLRLLGVAAPLRGGVQVGPVVFGRTGLGPVGLPPARAAIAVVGVGRVLHNGRVIAQRAPVQIFALAAGIHADDDTHRRLPAARAQDTELVVYVPSVPSDVLPGYLLAVFENPAISIRDQQVPRLAQVPVTQTQVSTGGGGGFLSGTDASTELAPPLFEGARDELPLTVPGAIPAVPLPASPAPLNAAPARPLLPTPPPGQAPLLAPAAPIGVTLPVTPLPVGIPPANAQTGPNGAPSLPQPLNAAPAAPLPPGIPPANAAP